MARWPVAVALPCAVLGLAAALHHPLSPLWAAAIFAVVTVVCTRWPMIWLTALPALLPVIDLAPWTGWLLVEEFDLLVLAVAAGGYARLTVDMTARSRAPAAGQPRLLAPLLVGLYGIALGVSAWRGLSAAGGLQLDWFQGYREAGNSLRLVKSLVEVLLLFPLWTACLRRDPERAERGLVDGLVAGLLATTLAAIWERAAYPGLLNFSSDYRTTALFWEMHVGGAALDGMLAVTFPFLALATLDAAWRRELPWRAALLPLAIYAAVTTFSRGVYVAVPVGVAVASALWIRQRRDLLHWPSAIEDTLLAAALCAVYSYMAASIFPSSGYRGMLALLILAALGVALPPVLRRRRGVDFALALAAASLLAALALAAQAALPRLVYVAFAATAAFCAAALFLARRGGRPARAPAVAALAAFAATAFGAVVVARHWGGAAAAFAAWPAVLAVAALPMVASWPGSAWWPASARWQMLATAGLCVCAIGVAAFHGGGYMSGRFSTTAGDYGERLTHWRQAMVILGGSDWWLGRGTGRFVDDMALAAPLAERPGDYRLGTDAQGPYLTLSAGHHVLGWGEMQRVSQRIAGPEGTPTLELRVRSDDAVDLHAEVCFKHLLYDDGCTPTRLTLAKAPGTWRPASLRFDKPLPRAAGGRLPRFVVFSISNEQPGTRIDVAGLELHDAFGRSLLTNGSFEQGLARWFMSSDRLHLPWHAKNLALHVLFEQGLVGLVLLGSLLFAAIVRLVLRQARHHALAPAVVGGLAGFVAIGAFDSLLDVPRVAFIFYFLIMLGLTMKPAAAAHIGRPQASSAPGR